MRSAFVESRNVSTEWPWGVKVFSVMVRPPAGEQFADVISVMIEPNGGMASTRREICVEDKGARSCSAYVTPADVAVTIYFRSRGTASRDSLVEGIREYLDKQVLACP